MKARGLIHLAITIALGGSAALLACVGDDAPPAAVDPGDGGSSSGSSGSSGTSGGDASGDSPTGDAACAFTPCSTGCADLTSSAENCGACGHSCQGGACVASTCQPVTLAASPAGGAPKDIKVEGAHVFWTVEALGTAGGGVFQANVTGANQTAVAIASGTAEANDNARAVAAHGAEIYWTTTDNVRIWHGSVDHATVPTLLTTLGTTYIAYGLALNPAGTHVYTATLISPDVVNGRDCTTSAPISCTGLFTPDSNGTFGPLYIVADASQVFWTEPGRSSVRKALMGGNQTASDISTTETNVDLLTTDGGFVYWVVTNAIHRSPVGSANPQPVISTGTTPSGIAADATNVYWSDAVADEIRYAPAAGGGTAKKLATAHAGRIARDTTAIYWTESGTIKKVALP